MKGKEGYKLEDVEGYKTLAKNYEKIAESSEKKQLKARRA